MLPLSCKPAKGYYTLLHKKAAYLSTLLLLFNSLLLIRKILI